MQVNAITKSGTNTLAGTFSGYFRDDRFNAADFIAEARAAVLEPAAERHVRRADPAGPDPLLRQLRVRARAADVHLLERRIPRFNIDQPARGPSTRRGARLDAQFSPQTRLDVRVPDATTTAALRRAGGASTHPSARDQRRARYSDQCLRHVDAGAQQPARERDQGRLQPLYNCDAAIRSSTGPATASRTRRSADARLADHQLARLHDRQTRNPQQHHDQNIYSIRDDFTLLVHDGAAATT